MSKFTTAALTAAIALSMSGAAFATGKIVATNNTFAKEVTKADANGNPTARTGSVAYGFVSGESDILIGRTNNSGDITVFATLTGADLNMTAAELDAVLTSQGSPGGAVLTGGKTFQFRISPPASPGFTSADLFAIAGLNLKNVSASGVTIKFEIRDTNTNLQLANVAPATILTIVDSTTTQTVDNVNNVIDVLTDAKRKFVGTPNTVSAHLGAVKINSGTVSVDGTGAVANDTNGATVGGTFQFDTANDKLNLTLNVPSPAAFTGAGMFYVQGGVTTCSATLPTGTASEPVATFTQSTSDATKFTASVAIPNATGETLYKVCAIASGATVIDAQTIGLTAQIDLAGALTIDPAPKTSSTFNTFVYNGAVKKVWHFNPASNMGQQSYLRITNTSTTSGLVTIEGVCDNAQAAASTTKMNLGAGKSVLLTSQDVENGNADKGVWGGLGACAPVSKYRLTITGEFASMEVQNFLRNATSAGIINTNVNIEDDNTDNNGSTHK